MNSLIQNYEIILKALTTTCADIPCFHQIWKPKLSGLEQTSPDLTARFMMYNSEEQLFSAIKNTYLKGKSERIAYNRRRRKLFAYTEQIRRRMCGKFSFLSNLFIVDSTSVEICQTVRAGRSNICAIETIRNILFSLKSCQTAHGAIVVPFYCTGYCLCLQMFFPWHKRFVTFPIIRIMIVTFFTFISLAFLYETRFTVLDTAFHLAFRGIDKRFWS